MPTTILTLRLDARSQAHFERLRQVHYPQDRNQIPAHLTLFHRLPETNAILEVLQKLGKEQPVFPLAVKGLLNLGRGVAYELASPTLMDLHRGLAANFRDYLTVQDQQRFRPHVVIQNKAAPSEALALLSEMKDAAFPVKVQACGFDLWRYLDGPWLHLRTFTFRASELAGQGKIWDG